jgi:hypothetical protein
MFGDPALRLRNNGIKINSEVLGIDPQRAVGGFACRIIMAGSAVGSIRHQTSRAATGVAPPRQQRLTGVPARHTATPRRGA